MPPGEVDAAATADAEGVGSGVGGGGGVAVGGGGGGSGFSGGDVIGESEAARQLGALIAMLDAAQADDSYQKLWFDFRHITDELVFFGMSAQSTQLVSPLANLCYKMLFRHEIFETFSGSSSATGPGAGEGGAQPRQQRRMLNLATEARAQLPPKLVLWVKQLSYFLMHFPDVKGGIAPLRNLHDRLVVKHRERRPQRSAEASAQSLAEREPGGA